VALPSTSAPRAVVSVTGVACGRKFSQAWLCRNTPLVVPPPVSVMSRKQLITSVL